MLLAAAADSSTTSIPTWLVVLVPVVSVVAGGLLGWLAASRTAERTAALARQDEQRRWNRERREKAYIALLDRRNQLVEIQRQWDEGDPDKLGRSLTDIHEHVRDDLDAQQSLGEALAVVELVGTTAAVELSRRWVQALCASRHAGQSRPVKGETTSVENSLRTEPVTFRDPFVALIRTELGVDD